MDGMRKTDRPEATFLDGPSARRGQMSVVSPKVDALQADVDRSARMGAQSAQLRQLGLLPGGTVPSHVAQLGKGKTTPPKEAPQEAKWKSDIETHGFEPGNVKIGGMGTANADISAADAARIWLFESKGANAWQSADNIAHDHNTPAKQLSRKLLGMMERTVRAYSEYEKKVNTISVAELLNSGDEYGEARGQLLLGVSNTDRTDALLGLQYNTTTAAFDGTKGASLPLTLTSVLQYLTGVEFVHAQDEATFKSDHRRDLEDISQAWSDWPNDDGRSFLTRNPTYLIVLEAAYTFARQKGEGQTLHGKALDPLADDIEFRFLPVVRDLTHVEKPAKDTVQQRAAPAAARAKSTPVVQRRKFKDVDEARDFLRPLLVGTETGEGEEMAAFLKGDLLQHKEANKGLLIKAFRALVEGSTVADFVGTRDLVKRRTVTEAVWSHIARGEVKPKVVGYHWKGLGNEANVEAYGDQRRTDRFGCYVQAVRSVNKTGAQNFTPVLKSTDSTFFPDDWSEQDIRMAIEHAVQEGSQPELTVTFPIKAKGMVLFKNDDSFFPVIQ
ncbi:MAG: hypothetical protein EOP37_11610 [Rubrivivax sp.]|nr:MAG: hypothetical protein EOP37_11610 [Rubrivivax sp.]